MRNKMAKKTRKKQAPVEQRPALDRIRTRNQNQVKYLEQLEDKEIVFSIGPAGVGKTLLAVAHGLTLLQNGDVEKLVITRPAVEAGESLGFLPGDLEDKLHPYMLPIYDFIGKMTTRLTAKKMLEDGTIEVAPLAFMRGRTFDDAYIILDEAQNTTPNQMKMFLTRIGMRSKAVITGDPDQSDIRGENGLTNAMRTLSSIDDIGFTYFDNKDIVRNPIITKIIKAYDGQSRTPSERAEGS